MRIATQPVQEMYVVELMVCLYVCVSIGGRVIMGYFEAIFFLSTNRVSTAENQSRVKIIFH